MADTFDTLDDDSASTIFDVLGVSAFYHGNTINVILDRDVELFPGGFDSAVSETRDQIVVLRSDAPNIAANDFIIIDSQRRVIHEILPGLSDKTVIHVALK